jgi:uncharacterized protein YlxW (UPF0749 family)
LIALVVSVVGLFVGEKVTYVHLLKKMIHPQNYQHVNHEYQLSLHSLKTKRKTYEKKFRSLKKKQQDLQTQLEKLENESKKLSLHVDKQNEINIVLQKEQEKIQNIL